MRDLKGKVAIVTGASKGLGKAIARRFAQGGASVVALARSLDRLEELAGEFPERILPVPCDMTRSEQVREAVETALQRFGQVDILVNNAGVGRFAMVHELAEEDWDIMLNVNLKGVFLACKYTIPHLIRQKGHIINISSVAGTVTFPKGGGYCASKFGLMALSEVLTQELKKDQVKVTTLCPGSIRTEFFPEAAPSYALKPEQVADTVWSVVTAPEGVIYNQVIMRPQVPPEYQK